MSRISFALNVKPRSVQFNKRARVGDAGDRGAPIRFYNDQEKKSYYRTIVAISAYHTPHHPWDGPIRMSATFVFPRPLRLMRPSSPPGELLYTAKPDLVNLIKGLEDALSLARFWKDDRQIVEYGTMAKVYAALGKDPEIRVTLELLDQSPVPPIA